MATTSQIIGAAILFGIYAIFILYFVVKGSGGTKNMNDYAVGSFSFSPYFVALSLAASMTSAATFVINPGLIATYGLSAYLSYGVIFPIASMVSLILLTKSFRKYGTVFKALSLSGWIRKRYESKTYGLFIGFMTVLMITFIVLIIVALVKVISQALNANQIWVLGITIAFIFGYMMFGGANSMVYTNMVQALTMVLVALILVGSGIKFFKEGIDGFFFHLTKIDPVLLQKTHPRSPLFRDFFEIIFAQLIVGAAVVCQPHIITKSLLLKKENEVNKFLITSVVVQILFYSVVFVGFFARLSFPDLSYNGMPLNVDSIIPSYVIEVFSGGIVALIVGLIVILGLISAGFSTIEGLIQSLSTTITMDLVKPIFGKNIKEERYVVINRMVILALAITTFFVARQQIISPNVSVAIFAQNGVYAYFSVLFVPIIFGIFLKKVKKTAAFAGSIVALIVYFTIYYGFPTWVQNGDLHLGYANIYFNQGTQNPAIAAATAIILSLTSGLLVHLFTKKQIEIKTV